MSAGGKKASFVGSVVHATRRCLSVFIHLAPPDLPPEVTNLLASLQMTNRDVDILYRRFQQLRQHDPIMVSTLPTEVCASSVLFLVRTRRDMVEGMLQRLLELGGHTNVIPWESFLYVLLNFCQLSKIELCQVLFFIISKEMKSWTVHHLTCAQLEEFYEEYERCDVKSFNTSHIQFSRLPLSKYTMYEFVELVHRYGVLINPLLHLQRSIQQALPSLRFWSDYDRVEVFNREISIDFFRIQKCQTILDVISGAGAKEVVKQLEGRVGVEIGAHEDAAAAAAAFQGKNVENAPLLLGSESFLPLPYLPGGQKHPPPKQRSIKDMPATANRKIVKSEVHASFDIDTCSQYNWTFQGSDTAASGSGPTMLLSAESASLGILRWCLKIEKGNNVFEVGIIPASQAARFDYLHTYGEVGLKSKDNAECENLKPFDMYEKYVEVIANMTDKKACIMVGEAREYMVEAKRMDIPYDEEIKLAVTGNDSFVCRLQQPEIKRGKGNDEYYLLEDGSWAPTWMERYNKTNEDPQTGAALGSAKPALPNGGRAPPEVAKLSVTFSNATGLPIPTHSYASCEINGRPQTRVRTAVVWGTDPVWNEVHEIYGYVVGETKALHIKILDNAELVKHTLHFSHFYPYGFDGSLPYPGGALRIKIEVTLPKTVKDAKEMIKSTFSEETRLANKGLGAQMAEQLALAKETLSTIARVQELDFIAKSRQSQEKRDNIVSIIHRSAQCELIERPVPKIFGLFRT